MEQIYNESSYLAPCGSGADAARLSAGAEYPEVEHRNIVPAPTCLSLEWFERASGQPQPEAQQLCQSHNPPLSAELGKNFPSVSFPSALATSASPMRRCAEPRRNESSTSPAEPQMKDARRSTRKRSKAVYAEFRLSDEQGKRRMEWKESKAEKKYGEAGNSWHEMKICI